MQFNFGENWKNFSNKALTKEKVDQAKIAFKDLFADINIRDRSFLDIGFGQGLSLLIATEMGAKPLGVDINPLSKEVIDYNKKKFDSLKDKDIPTITGSILDNKVISQIKSHNKLYDVVHSWGVLHHTGDMWSAIKKSSELVNSKGYYVLSIYNRHWSSLIWLFIKWLYNRSPKVFKYVYIYSLFPIIFLAKLVVTKGNPLNKSRGMDFFYDVIDWVGGYPYEYATADEVINYITNLGFKHIKLNKALVPTGCNEFIFQRSL